MLRRVTAEVNSAAALFQPAQVESGHPERPRGGRGGFGGGGGRGPGGKHDRW